MTKREWTCLRQSEYCSRSLCKSGMQELDVVQQPINISLYTRALEKETGTTPIKEYCSFLNEYGKQPPTTWSAAC